MSLPARERGSKPSCDRWPAGRGGRRSPLGSVDRNDKARMNGRLVSLVAPRSGAWIETGADDRNCQQLVCRSPLGSVDRNRLLNGDWMTSVHPSLPARERGSKPFKVSLTNRENAGSLPARGAWIENRIRSGRLVRVWSRSPLGSVDRNTLEQQGYMCGNSRSPLGSVDRNVTSAPSPVRSKRRSPLGSVDRNLSR